MLLSLENLPAESIAPNIYSFALYGANKNQKWTKTKQNFTSVHHWFGFRTACLGALTKPLALIRLGDGDCLRLVGVRGVTRPPLEPGRLCHR